MKATAKVTAVILAAGEGKRMNARINKLFIRLRKPIICHCIDAFDSNKLVTDIILVINGKHRKWFEKEITSNGFKKISRLVIGGPTRQDSSRNGVQAASGSDIILVHDGARPFVNDATITNSILDAEKYGASVAGVPAKDTIKIVGNNYVEKTVDRSKLWIIQTPQAFRGGVIMEAHLAASNSGFLATDEAMLVERLGGKVRVTMGHYDNIKITTPDDLVLAQKIIEGREKCSGRE